VASERVDRGVVGGESVGGGGALGCAEEAIRASDLLAGLRPGCFAEAMIVTPAHCAFSQLRIRWQSAHGAFMERGMAPMDRHPRPLWRALPGAISRSAHLPRADTVSVV